MIKHHATGTNTTLPQLRQRFTGIAQVPDIGRGIRTRWADENAPTDAELRLIGHSYRQDVPRPVNTIPAPDALIDDVWVQQWTPISDDELRARIVAQIKAAAGEHIRAVLPDWKQSNMHALAQELSEVRETREMTPAETLQYQALLASWAWAKSVRAASDVAEADVALMDRAALDAWTMPSLPEWGA